MSDGGGIRRGRGYGGGMSPKEPEGTPSLQSVEEDFTMPEDADLRPVDEDGEVEQP